MLANDYYFDRPREEILPFVPPSTRRLLDVGCANGVFASLVKQRLGADAWGVEINRAAARVAAGRLDRVISKDVFEALAELPDGHFDCITFNDVLEHLTDPYRLLGEIRGKLAPGGVVVASIPNVRHYSVLWDLAVRGDWAYQDWGILDRTHLRFFTLKSIRRMFDEQGYRLVSATGINGPPTRVGRVAARLLVGPLADVRWIQFACTATPA